MWGGVGIFEAVSFAQSQGMGGAKPIFYPRPPLEVGRRVAKACIAGAITSFRHDVGDFKFNLPMVEVGNNVSSGQSTVYSSLLLSLLRTAHCSLLTLITIHQVCAEIEVKHKIPAANFPNADEFKRFFTKNDLYDFPKLEDWDKRKGVHRDLSPSPVQGLREGLKEIAEDLASVSAWLTLPKLWCFASIDRLQPQSAVWRPLPIRQGPGP